jgi:hypothetical protein
MIVQSGCSIYKAANQPPPIDFTHVKVGASRPQLISAFGHPKHSEVVGDKRTDMFEFIDGYPSESKVRVIFYAAADFFLLFLPELIFWPLEMAVMDGVPGNAIAEYDDKSIVKELSVTDKEGKPWMLQNSGSKTEPSQLAQPVSR